MAACAMDAAASDLFGQASTERLVLVPVAGGCRSTSHERLQHAESLGRRGGLSDPGGKKMSMRASTSDHQKLDLPPHLCSCGRGTADRQRTLCRSGSRCRREWSGLAALSAVAAGSADRTLAFAVLR